ncbi:stellacyanin-like [Andrographis paniculata]|uniref:stellacyanin-like n=1 Tax=Andrographis paniculata TaxID=175694 RepID=UPI0021E93083|nr:stellacyanin-like [Andrographis paniculata]
MATATSSCLLLTALFFFFFNLCDCTEFQVGETTGWTVPPRNDTEFYNNWASAKRFTIGDTIRFSYGKKDSVMEVSKRDYEDCNSTRPNYFSNTGDTIFALNRSGRSYFISGTAGHCRNGQRMVVWVITQQDHSHAARSSAASGGGLAPITAAVITIIGSVCCLPFF